MLVDKIVEMINTELDEFTKMEEEVMIELDPLATLKEVFKKEKMDHAQELGVVEQLLWNLQQQQKRLHICNLYDLVSLWFCIIGSLPALLRVLWIQLAADPSCFKFTVIVYIY